MIFKYDPGTMRARFKKQGYVLLKDILDDRFLAHLSEFYDRSQSDDDGELQGWKIYGKKRQFLFSFSSQEDANEFRDGMARLTGIDRDSFTISERHLKVYDAAAEPWPAPHKDRASSEISIGLPIRLPAGSSACVLPKLGITANTDDRAIFLTDRDHPTPGKVYEMEEAIKLNEQIGDVVVFLGSALFHERINGGGTAILYLKVNGSGQDPLGENIFDDISMPQGITT